MIRDPTCHLTATEKQAIEAILASPDFMFGQAYRTGRGRKTYVLTDAGGGRLKVAITQRESDWVGPPRDVTRSQTFTHTR